MVSLASSDVPPDVAVSPRLRLKPGTRFEKRHAGFAQPMVDCSERFRRRSAPRVRTSVQNNHASRAQKKDASKLLASSTLSRIPIQDSMIYSAGSSPESAPPSPAAGVSAAGVSASSSPPPHPTTAKQVVNARVQANIAARNFFMSLLSQKLLTVIRKKDPGW
jgi:hypothetical protein